MKDPVLIGIDAGTSVIKSIAFSADGRQLAVAAIPNFYATLSDGGAEQDMGRTWAQYDLKELGPRSPVRFDRKNSDGWFRIDLRSGWIQRAEVLFIKPKHP